MHLKRLELNGFKSFAKHSEFIFDVPIIAIVGPNGSGKSNVVEAIRFVLGEQSVKSMRGKTGSDLIFKGSKLISKASRASVVIVFDNSDRVFHIHQDNNSKIDIDFDEITISREVYVDGSNKYMINGHEVRMKDVHELIGSVNIGSSGHHIISQGEADRYLNANIRDRRVLIEEALGLKVYQYRLKESRRKLEKAEANIRESGMLRRELAPHLRFLKRQVDKFEKAKHLREDLSSQYREYFAREEYLTNKISNEVSSQKADVDGGLSKLESFFTNYQNPEEFARHEEEELIGEKKSRIQDLQEKISHNAHELGKVEGMISLLEKQSLGTGETKATGKKQAHFSYNQVKTFFSKILQSLDILSSENMIEIVSSIKTELNDFIEEKETTDNQLEINHSGEINELTVKKDALFAATKEAQSSISNIEAEIVDLNEKLSEKHKIERDSQKQYYESLAVKKELEGKKEVLAGKIENLNRRKLDRDEELREAIVLIGEQAVQYEEVEIEHIENTTEQSQESARRGFERIKIRLEDIGGGSGIEVLNEYNETKERDEFLEKEIQDVKETIESLNKVISDLKETLNIEFDAGIEKINVQFDRFFKLMFGGGSAQLAPQLIQKRRYKKAGEDLENPEIIEEDEKEEEEEKEYGIDIKVKLPRKKVSDLEMLSGGERSLTSIALLFALSQVNPPPFLVLDETDAALDEANSKKYGDMIESLSEFSQLILVTHNRETMSRAHTLFGVTLGRGDHSSLLSLRLEDATKYAK